MPPPQEGPSEPPDVVKPSHYPLLQMCSFTVPLIHTAHFWKLKCHPFGGECSPAGIHSGEQPIAGSQPQLTSLARFFRAVNNLHGHTSYPRASPHTDPGVQTLPPPCRPAGWLTVTWGPTTAFLSGSWWRHAPGCSSSGQLPETPPGALSSPVHPVPATGHV